MAQVETLPRIMTSTAAVAVVGQDDDEQVEVERAFKDSEEVGGGGGDGDGSGGGSSCSDTPPSLSPSSSLIPISMSPTSGEEDRSIEPRDADYYDAGDIASVSVSAAVATATSSPSHSAEFLPQPTTATMEIPPRTPPATEATATESKTQMLEARIVQLEQTLRVLVTTLQEQQQQLHQQNHLPHQQLDDGSIQEQHLPGHTREGSDTTTTTGRSGTSRSSSSSPPTPNSPLLDPTLSQWPPSNNHCLLESPDHVALTLTRRTNQHQRNSRQRRLLQQQLHEQHQLEQQHRNRRKKGKTRSMVLLDIDADEQRGPRYVIPFNSSDLDICCSDEITDGDSIKSGRIEEGVGGEEENEGEESPSLVRPSTADSESGKSITGTMNLTCQGYSDAHWEALRMRREAGRSDRRAYSYNDRDFRTTPTLPLVSKQPWRPTLDSVDGSTKDPNSATSAAVNFAEDCSRKLNEDIDIVMPDLRFPDIRASSSDDKNLLVPQDQLLVAIDAKHDEAVMQSAEDDGIASTGEKAIAHSSSCNSNMSSDSYHTAKMANTNSVLSPRGSIGGMSITATPPSTSSKERSLSVASAKSDIGTLLQSVETTGDTATATISITPKSHKVHKNGSPHTHASIDSTTLVEPNNKNNQTMKEYVMNDLLNIDSRNQDGSATEDVDANMEEFLRIPPKLEYLMFFSLAVCMDSFLYVWTMLPLKLVWCVVCLACSIYSPKKGVRGVKFHRRHLYPLMQSIFIFVVYSQVLCPISIGKLYHWIRGQAMLKLYVLIAIVEVFDRLLCSFGQDAWDSLYWNTTRRPRHPRTVVSIIVVGVYVTIHSLFLFVHVATLSVAVNSADNALLTLLISGNFAEIKSTVFKKYNKHHLFKITTSDICERFKLGLFLLLILFLNSFQGEMTSSMVKDYYSMCGIVFIAELISDWIKHSFITKFNLIKSFVYFDYALVLSGDVTGIGHEGLHLDYTHAAVKRLGLAQIPLVCVTARYIHEAVRYAIIFQGNGDIDHPLAALAFLVADGSKWKFFKRVLQGMFVLVLFKIALGMCIRHVARGYLGVANNMASKGDPSARKSSTGKMIKDSDGKKSQ